TLDEIDDLFYTKQKNSSAYLSYALLCSFQRTAAVCDSLYIIPRLFYDVNPFFAFLGILFDFY
ncbi:MAG: hypothetical protein E7K64_03195, partial [Clostridia bacterium]|nr:hypothetical protein [Clostridiales bacterium]MDU7505037.1 hypothetical protein [Clostridia bacterium]